MTDAQPERAHPSHGVLRIEGQPTIVFDTVCTKYRAACLANDDVHQLLRDVWHHADAWLLGRYVILPDHLHFFAAMTDWSMDYESWIRYWKSQFTKRHAGCKFQWLSDHWDTRVRNVESYEAKWEYVRSNPVRHGLVERPEDWPYQGEIHHLPWD